jgi:hypothetical protein
MAELKTKPTEQTASSFIDAINDEQVRDDCNTVIKIMKKITGKEPVMWGSSIIGFGKYRYGDPKGHHGEMCLTGFSPRKGNLSLYVLAGAPMQQALLDKLGKYKAGKGCLYVKKLEDVNLKILSELIEESLNYMKKQFPDHD